ncbi:MAG TPA: TerB family tellurite resistance protein [Candidatus Omnitrophica bacterium]|nr:TerB family tellurite resistance protein [Candidatus Omnitrophota bacterium]
MTGFLDKFRKKVILNVWKDKPDESKVKEIDDKIALGVLLWVVAETDEKFLPQEEEKIKEILISHSKISDSDIPTVLASIKAASDERIDLYPFTRQISQNLPHEIKLSIIENLFRVACVDKDLDAKEMGMIRKISGLFRIEHSDFIDAKIKIKKEFGLDVSEA